ncbi:MAG: isopentenyl-diphosphate Delta-isomerase [Woeseiaceae bacterium]
MNKAARTDRVVSSDDEPLILVDHEDRELGFLDKGRSHDGGGRLHRAFSLFLFNDRGEVLLQQRAAGKRLWPLFWSNSCCSHPRRGESMELATRRRLHDELNVTADLQFVFKFVYHARYGSAGSEHELCWVYLGKCEGEVAANSTEIADHRWVTPGQLSRDLADRAGDYTPWLHMEWERLTSEWAETLSGYCRAR